MFSSNFSIHGTFIMITISFRYLLQGFIPTYVRVLNKIFVVFILLFVYIAVIVLNFSKPYFMIKDAGTYAGLKRISEDRQKWRSKSNVVNRRNTGQKKNLISFIMIINQSKKSIFVFDID